MVAAPKKVSDSGIQVLARAADILRLIEASRDELSQVEIGQRLSLPRSTVSRLLMALEVEGFVKSANSRGRYRLGSELVRLASAARKSEWRILHPLLVELSEEVNETVDLSILEGDHAVCIDQVMGNNRLNAVVTTGDSIPLHASANGKAMLAYMSEADLKRALKSKFEKLTPNTTTDPKLIRAELEIIRQDKLIAFDREEVSVGISAIGAVVGFFANELVAVSIPVPTQRFGGEEAKLTKAVLAFVLSARGLLAGQ